MDKIKTLYILNYDNIFELYQARVRNLLQKRFSDTSETKKCISKFFFFLLCYQVIRFMSIASNMLNNIPTSTLNLTAHSLQYLSLAGNDFHYVFEQYNTTFRKLIM